MSVVTALRLGVKMLSIFSVLSKPAMLLELGPGGGKAEEVRRQEQTSNPTCRVGGPSEAPRGN